MHATPAKRTLGSRAERTQETSTNERMLLKDRQFLREKRAALFAPTYCSIPSDESKARESPDAGPPTLPDLANPNRNPNA